MLDALDESLHNILNFMHPIGFPKAARIMLRSVVQRSRTGLPGTIRLPTARRTPLTRLGSALVIATVGTNPHALEWRSGDVLAGPQTLLVGDLSPQA